jgi:hypothetical protein
VQVTKRFGHVALFEAQGDDEDLVHEQARFFEGEFQLLVAVSVLLVERARQADDCRIACEDRLADLMLPVLPGLQVFHIEPRVDSIPPQALMQFVNGSFVAVGVDEKNAYLFC